MQQTSSVSIRRLGAIASLSSLTVILLLSACASAVKLDEPAPVTDGKTAVLPAAPASTPVAPPPPAPPQVADTRAVAPVDVSGSATAGQPPQGISRIVYFDYDSFQIKPEFQAAIEAHAKFLKANASRKVSLEGHTDERGGREYNLALGQRRAEAVSRALRLMGVADAQSEAVSFGKEKPADSASNEAAFAKNRRVELFYK